MTDPTTTPPEGTRLNVALPEGYAEWPEEQKRAFVREVIDQMRPAAG